MADGPRFRGVATLEGVTTSDKRTIGLNETAWRPLPLSLMVMTKASHGGAPSTETQVGGRIDTIERRPGPVEGSFELYFEGAFTDDELGMKTASLVGSQALRGVSIDFAADEQLEVLEEDAEGSPIDYLLHYTNVEIGMATVCPFPAFEGGYIELAEPLADAVPAEQAAELVDVAAAGLLDGLTTRPCVVCTERAGELVAAGGPVDPPEAWFSDPHLDGPSPLTITPDGRIFGHLATWDTCHVGISGQCITPPRSATGYARFRVASTLTAEGTTIPTGVLFTATSHAPTRGGLGISAVQDHYADTGTATADVAAGEDAYGVWVAGAMRPGLTAEQVRAARGSVLSGDWRTHGGRLELVAALHVNVGGFPVPHAQLVASGSQVALVAAGARRSLALAQGRTAQLDEAGVARIVATEMQRQLAPLFAAPAEARREQARTRLAALQTAGPALAHVRAARERIDAARVRLTAAGGPPLFPPKDNPKAPPATPTPPTGNPDAEPAEPGEAPETPTDETAEDTFLTGIGDALGPIVDTCDAMLQDTKDPDIADYARHLRDTLAAQGATAQHLLDGNTSDGASMVASSLAIGKATNPVGTARLMEYWSHGEGAAKIGWGSPGDHTRCVRELGKYVGPGIVHGLCTNLQEKAVGYAGNPGGKG